MFIRNLAATITRWRHGVNVIYLNKLINSNHEIEIKSVYSTGHLELSLCKHIQKTKLDYLIYEQNYMRFSETPVFLSDFLLMSLGTAL